MSDQSDTEAKQRPAMTSPPVLLGLDEELALQMSFHAADMKRLLASTLETKELCAEVKQQPSNTAESSIAHDQSTSNIITAQTDSIIPHPDSIIPQTDSIIPQTEASHTPTLTSDVKQQPSTHAPLSADGGGDVALGLDEELQLEEKDTQTGTEHLHTEHKSAAAALFPPKPSIRIQVVQKQSFTLDPQLLRDFPQSVLTRMFACMYMSLQCRLLCT